jgi:hypothetical protein
MRTGPWRRGYGVRLWDGAGGSVRSEGSPNRRVRQVRAAYARAKRGQMPAPRPRGRPEPAPEALLSFSDACCSFCKMVQTATPVKQLAGSAAGRRKNETPPLR